MLDDRIAFGILVLGSHLQRICVSEMNDVCGFRGSREARF